jgi:hypothetical protein
MNKAEKIERMRKGIEFTKEHIDNSNFTGAVVVGMAVLEQMLALIEGEDLDAVSNPDVTITTEVDCSDGEDK